MKISEANARVAPLDVVWGRPRRDSLSAKELNRFYVGMRVDFSTGGSGVIKGIDGNTLEFEHYVAVPVGVFIGIKE